jgi:hypothetical protein
MNVLDWLGDYWIFECKCCARVQSHKRLDGKRNKLSAKNSAFDDPMQK